MNTKNVLVGVGLVVVLFLGVTFPRGNSVVKQAVNNLGASGPDFFAHVTLHEGVTTGGSTATSTATSAETLNANELTSVNSWTITPSAVVTITLPASSSIPWLPEKGMTRWMYVKNSGTVAITFASNVGTTIRAGGAVATSTILYKDKGAWFVWYRSATSTPLGNINVTMFTE